MLKRLHGRFVTGRTGGRLVNNAIGDHPETEIPVVPLDPVTRFGADTQYKANVKAGYTLNPFGGWAWTLHASNKPSEHNIFNIRPVIPVSQYAGQTQAPDVRRIVSRRIRLPQPQGGA